MRCSEGALVFIYEIVSVYISFNDDGTFYRVDL